MANIYWVSGTIGLNLVDTGMFNQGESVYDRIGQTCQSIMEELHVNCTIIKVYVNHKNW